MSWTGILCELQCDWAREGTTRGMVEIASTQGGPAALAQRKCRYPAEATTDAAGVPHSGQRSGVARMSYPQTAQWPPIALRLRRRSQSARGIRSTTGTIHIGTMTTVSRRVPSGPELLKYSRPKRSQWLSGYLGLLAKNRKSGDFGLNQEKSPGELLLSL